MAGPDTKTIQHDGFSAHSYGAVHFVIWHRVPDAPAWEQAEAAADHLLADAPKHFGLIVMLRGGLPAELPEAMVPFAKSLRSRVVALAHVLPATPNDTLATHATLRAVAPQVGGLSGPIRVFHEPAAAADWMEARLRMDGLEVGTTPLREVLARLLAECPPVQTRNGE